MNESLKTVIDSAKSILILLPKNPYFDQVAAGLGLYLGLKATKDVSISCPTPMVVDFNRLVGVNKISSELGNKNLVVKFKDYNAEGIERVSYDIDGDEFRLSVIPKNGVIPPSKEQIAITYSGVAADTVILIGGANESHFPDLSKEDLLGAKLVHVGTNNLVLSNMRKYISLSENTSSTSEVVAKLLKGAGISFDGDIATNLLSGMHIGSKGFSSMNVTSETFQLAADLMQAGGKHNPKDRIEKKDFPRGSVPSPVSNPKPIQETKSEEPPKAWLEPKIYKGTSVS